MKIVVGLGNPGKRYELTRHNIGFLAVDYLLEKWSGSFSKKFHSEVASCQFGSEKVLLMKPQTFMNLSGKAVAAAMQFYQCSPDELIVIHDELDISPYSIRLKKGGGAGGHNGLKSIDEYLSSQDYYRIRTGIGHPRLLERPINPADYVLMPFPKEETSELESCLDKVTKATELVLGGEFTQAMNLYHTK